MFVVRSTCHSLCWWRVVHSYYLVPPKHCPGVHTTPHETTMRHALMFHEVNDSKQSKGGASYHVIQCMVCMCAYAPRLPTVVFMIVEYWLVYVVQLGTLVFTLLHLLAGMFDCMISTSGEVTWTRQGMNTHITSCVPVSHFLFCKTHSQFSSVDSGLLWSGNWKWKL